MSVMNVSKSEKVKIKLSVEDALKMRSEFGKLGGIEDDMVIMEFIERLDMVL